MGHDDGVVARVTLQTVADRVGVSRTTVSNAYNRPDQLGDELRNRILGAAQELGYRGPDAAGRMLRTGRMGAIGLLFTEDLRFVFTDPDTTQFMLGVAETSALAGTGLTLLPVPLGTEVSETAVPYVAVDGYLVFSVPIDHPALETVLRRGKPVVVVDEPDLGDATSFVGIDDRAGAKMAAEHLLRLGHRKIGILFGRLSLDKTPGQRSRAEVHRASIRVARDRMRGFEDALSSNTTSTWSTSSSGRQAETILTQGVMQGSTCSNVTLNSRHCSASATNWRSEQLKPDSGSAANYQTNSRLSASMTSPEQRHGIHLSPP